MHTQLYFFCLLGLAGLSGFTILAAEETLMSNIASYNRCYFAIVRERPPIDAVYARVALPPGRDGYLSAAKACMDLLQSTNFVQRTGDGGVRWELPSSTDRRARAILKNFNDFHRSWFTNDDYLKAAPIGCRADATDTIIYPGEPALHVTRTLFKPNTPFKEIVLGETSYEAVRVTPSGRPNEATRLGQLYEAVREGDRPFMIAHGFPIPIESPAVWRPSAADQKDTPWTSIYAPVGPLVGLRPISKLTLPDQESPPPNRELVPAFNVRSGFGGGVLGSQAFLALNFGREVQEKMDGGRLSPRRWAQSAYKDLMCRDLPVVRSSRDEPVINQWITRFIQSQRELPLSFRVNSLCMRCHVSHDSLSWVARNLFYTNGAPRLNLMQEQQGWTNSVFIAKNQGTPQPRETSYPDRDPLFHRRPTTGFLIYRPYSASESGAEGPINVEVHSLEELGRTLAGDNEEAPQIDDMYVCAAKRYVNFFTGYNANVTDLGPTPRTPLSPEDRELRNWVIQLGKQLKQHQSLPRLINDIINAPAYSRTNFGLTNQQCSVHLSLNSPNPDSTLTELVHRQGEKVFVNLKVENLRTPRTLELRIHDVVTGVEDHLTDLSISQIPFRNAFQHGTDSPPENDEVLRFKLVENVEGRQVPVCETNQVIIEPVR